MELLNKRYRLAFIYTVTVNDTAILAPSFPTTIVDKDGTRKPEDTEQVRRLLLAVVNGDKTSLHTMILEEVTYKLAREGDDIFEMVTGEDIDEVNKKILMPAIETLEEKDRKHFEGYEAIDLVDKIGSTFCAELEQVAFGEVPPLHILAQPAKKRRYRKNTTHKK